MKAQLIILCLLFIPTKVLSQKVVHYPNYVDMNFSADITKVELTTTETVLHFTMKGAIGGKFLIAQETYIEDSSGRGIRLYITKSEGVEISKWYTQRGKDELSYKLFFPPLENDVKTINYGESNPKGNWFIHKLDISKDGDPFYNYPQNRFLENVFITGIMTDSSKTISPASIITSLKTDKLLDEREPTLLPKNLPNAIFGNWFDKYGTLIYIITPDYIMANNRIGYYMQIKKVADTKFLIKSTSHVFEVLDFNSSTMSVRDNRLMDLVKRSSPNTVPEYIKGNWLHWQGIKRIEVTDDYFFNDDGGSLGVYEILKQRIDKVITSESGEVIWFVLYYRGNYELYHARKTKGELILGPQRFRGARYKKVDH